MSVKDRRLQRFLNHWIMTMDKGTQNELHIRRLPNGGYVVRDGHFEQGRYSPDLFASDSIESALAFIRDMITPIEPQQST